jgi:hypothetical protein
VVVAPETKLQAEGRSEPIYIQVMFVDNESRATGPATWDKPPTVVLDYVLGLVA